MKRLLLIGGAILIGAMFLPENPDSASAIRKRNEQRDAAITAQQNAETEKLLGCELYVQRRLKDPDSYKRINSWSDFKSTRVLIYSGTNSFGGRVQNTHKCS